MPIIQAVFTPEELNRIGVLLSTTFNRQFTYTSDSALGNRFIFTEEKRDGLEFKAVIYVDEKNKKNRITQISYIFEPKFFRDSRIPISGTFPIFDSCEQKIAEINPLLVSIKIADTHSDYKLSLSLKNFLFYSGNIEKLDNKNCILEYELVIYCQDWHIDGNSRKEIGIVSFLPHTLGFNGINYQEIDELKAAMLLRVWGHLGKKYPDISSTVPSSINSYDDLVEAFVRFKAVCEMSAI